MKRDLLFFLPCLLATFLFVPPLLERGSAKPPPPVVERESAVAMPALWLGYSAQRVFQSDIRLEDAVYVCPTTAQIPDLIAFCEKRRTKKYVPEGFDCDDFAREYRVNAALWSTGVWKDLRAAVAVGTAVVRLDGKVDGLLDFGPGLHALIVLRRADGVWIFIEPQTAKWVEAKWPIVEGVIDVLRIDL